MMSDVILAAGSSFGLSLIVKSTILAAAGLLAAAAVGRRARSAVRHLALAVTFGALLVLPALSAIGPTVAVPVAQGASRPIALTSAVSSSVPADRPRRIPIADVFADGWTLPRTVHALQNWSKIDWSLSSGAGIWLIYGMGALALMTSLVTGVWRTRRLLRTALPCLPLQPVVASLAAGAGIRRSIAVVTHEAVRSPLTFGIVRPAIVVPADIETWAAGDVERAVVHELEHVRRHDCALQLAARAVCALYWFNPLVWIAWRRLCLEAERSCDDAVVRLNASVEYAEQLVLLARRCSSAGPVTLGMARRSDLSARVTAVLDAQRRRGRAGRTAVGAALAAAALALLVVAPLQAIAADGNRESGLDLEQDRGRATSQDRALYRAAERGDLDRMAQLVRAGARVDAALDGDGSPLIGAARAGRLAAVAWLLDRGADPNLGVSGDGNPLIMAARQGHAEIVALLLDRGARIDQVVDGDENALIQASGEGRLPVVRLLVGRGADVNARVWAEAAMERPSGEWRSPLSMARKGGHTAVVTFLLEAGAR